MAGQHPRFATSDVDQANRMGSIAFLLRSEGYGPAVWRPGRCRIGRTDRGKLPRIGPIGIHQPQVTDRGVLLAVQFNKGVHDGRPVRRDRRRGG